MQLQDYGKSLAYDIAFWSVGLENPKYPINQLGRLSEELSEKLRTLAIISVVVKGDPNPFYHNLIRSSLARETYLKRCRAENFLEDYHLAISRSGALFDAMAANDFELALRIAKLSPREWISQGEYEDDYCFVQFFHLMLQDDIPSANLSAILQQFEVSLQGEESAKLNVCHSLALRDQQAFDEAFEGLIREHDAHLTEERERGQMEDAHVVAERRIFIEGLGILRVAEQLGLITQPEYKYCPALARLPMTIPFPSM